MGVEESCGVISRAGGGRAMVGIGKLAWRESEEGGWWMASVSLCGVSGGGEKLPFEVAGRWLELEEATTRRGEDGGLVSLLGQRQ
jgi:hypothetical protein